MLAKKIQTKILIGLSLSWISSTALAGAPNPISTPEKDPFELYDVVSSLGKDRNQDASAPSQFQIRVNGCSASETLTVCRVSGEAVAEESSAILFDAIQDVLGSVISEEAGQLLSRVPSALISCSLPVDPDATPTCTIQKLPLLGGGNVSVGGRSVKDIPSSER